MINKMDLNQTDEDTKCGICGYQTNRHLIHSTDGICYCSAHYLLHILNDDIAGETSTNEKIASDYWRFHH